MFLRKNTDWDYVHQAAAYLKESGNEVKMEKRGVLGSSLPLPDHVICFNLMETTEG